MPYRRRSDHQQPIRRVRHQQVRERRAVRPAVRPLAVRRRAAARRGRQRAVLVERLRRRLRRAVVPERAGAGAGLAAVREGAAQGECRGSGRGALAERRIQECCGKGGERPRSPLRGVPPPGAGAVGYGRAVGAGGACAAPEQ